MRRRNCIASILSAPLAGAASVASGATSGEPDDGTFKIVTTGRSTGSGEHWVTPLGIPFPFGTASDGPARNVTDAFAANMFIRYPAGERGSLYPIGWEAKDRKYRKDGKLLHGTGHVKLPANYSPGAKFEVGIKTSASARAMPDWPKITARGDDIVVRCTFFEPRHHFLALDRNPVAGDVIEIRISDSKGTLSYRREYDFQDDASHNNVSQHLWKMMAKDITEGVSLEGSPSRYRCYDINAVPATPGSWVQGRDILQQNPNHWPSNSMGVRFSLGKPCGYAPRRNYNATKFRDRWPVGSAYGGLYIWPRDNGGRPENYRVSVKIIRGLTLEFTGRSKPFEATHSIPYDNGTQGIETGARIRCAETLAEAVVVSRSGTSASGVLYVKQLDGYFPHDAQIRHEGDSRVRARVNGQTSRVTVTASSGLKGKLCAVIDKGGSGALYLADITGALADGATLTSAGGGTAVASGTGKTSILSFYKDNNGTLSTNDTLTPVNDASDGTVWEARFDQAAETLDSPWFTNDQVHQVETLAAPRNRGLSHPSYRIRFLVTYDNTGTVIAREVVAENAMMRSGARDHWMHFEVLVKGVSQTAGKPQWRHLYHPVWRSFRWQQDYAFGCCDPGDFMKARLVFPWHRKPTRNSLHDMASKIKGGHISGGFRTLSTTSPWWRGYVRQNWNEPLYTGGWDFGGTGGARPEINVWNMYEWFGFTGDILTNWPALEAAGDNVVGAWGFNVRDESATGDDYSGPPHLYLKWRHQTYVSYPLDYVIKAPTWDGVHDANPNFAVEHLYALTSELMISTDHGPAVASFGAYLLRPSKRFMDHQEQWAWFMTANAWVNGHPPKTGGVAGDPSHVLQWDSGNGNRGLSWMAREIFRAALVNGVGRRRHVYWRRAAEDMKKHFDKTIERTVFGIFHGAFRETRPGSGERVFYSSDAWDGPWTDLSEGKTMPPAMYGNNAYHGHNWPVPANWSAQGYTADQWSSQSQPDLFKVNYVMGAFQCAQDWNVVDCQSSWNRIVWPARYLWAMPNNEWTRALGGQSLPINATPMISGRAWNLGSSNGKWPIWPDNSMEGLKRWWATVPRPVANAWNGDSFRNYWEAGRLQLKGWGQERGPDTWGWAINYSYEGTHMQSLFGTWRYNSDPQYRALAKRYLDLWMTTFPPADTRAHNRSDNTTDLGDILMATGIIREEDITSW